jgi:phage shock protein A
MLQDMEQRLKEAMDQISQWHNERKQFAERINDTTEQ